MLEDYEPFSVLIPNKRTVSYRANTRWTSDAVILPARRNIGRQRKFSSTGSRLKVNLEVGNDGELFHKFATKSIWNRDWSVCMRTEKVPPVTYPFFTSNNPFKFWSKRVHDEHLCVHTTQWISPANWYVDGWYLSTKGTIMNLTKRLRNSYTDTGNSFSNEICCNTSIGVRDLLNYLWSILAYSGILLYIINSQWPLINAPIG